MEQAEVEELEVRMQDDSTYSSDKSAGANESETLTNASDGSFENDYTGWLAAMERERREQADQEALNDAILAQQDAAGIDSRAAVRRQVDTPQSDNEKQGTDASDESAAANEDVVGESLWRDEADVQAEHRRVQRDSGSLGGMVKHDQDEKEKQAKEEQAKEEQAKEDDEESTVGVGSIDKKGPDAMDPTDEEKR